jgi:AhpD family alkylhydroperoxidase
VPRFHEVRPRLGSGRIDRECRPPRPKVERLTRVELVTRERAPLLARRYFEHGDPGPITAALANVPELLETALPFLDTVYGPTSLAPRLKEIVILRVSSRCGCRYCTESHTAVAARLGFEADELGALRGELAVPARWSPRERALFAFAEAMADHPAAAVDALGTHFEGHEIVELVALASATVMLNRLATALELPF